MTREKFSHNKSASSPEYRIVSSECKKTSEPLDPNRVFTDAEIRLFADVFSISFAEACQILMKAGRRCEVQFQNIQEKSRPLFLPSAIEGDDRE